MKQKLQNASVVELVLSNPSNTYTTDRPYRPQWLIPQQHEAYSWEVCYFNNKLIFLKDLNKFLQLNFSH